MSALLSELIGTTLLVLLGDGVVANVVLQRTKGHAGGWIVITAGWSLAVFLGVLVSASASGAHLNPAVSVGLALANNFSWSLVPGYCAAQMLGACLGASLVWLQYAAHFEATDDANAKLAVFCTGPEIRSIGLNLVSEVLGTFVLVFAALNVSSPAGGLGVPGRAADCSGGPGDWLVAGGHNRLCDQSSPRPGAASDACAVADLQEAR